MKRILAIMCLGALCAAVPGRGAELDTQGASRRKHWLGILIGAGAGFGAGTAIGFAAFDEAINSEQKVYTSMAAGTLIGAVTGYFISRTLGREDESSSTAKFDPLFVPAASGRSRGSEVDGIERELSTLLRRSDQLPPLSYEPLVVRVADNRTFPIVTDGEQCRFVLVH